MDHDRAAEAEPLVQPAGTGRRWRAIVGRTLVSLLIGVSLYLILRELGLEFVPSAESLAKLDRGAVVLFVGLWLVGTALRVHRWLYLLRPIDPDVPPLRTFGLSLIGFAAIFAPMRMGEVARPVLIAREGKIGFLQGLGTVAAERIVDGVMLTCIAAAGLLIAPPLNPLPQGLGAMKLPLRGVTPTIWLALLVFLGAFVAMGVFYFWRAIAHRVVFRLVALVSTSLAEKVTSQVERLSDSLQFLMSRHYAPRFLAYTAGYWLCTVLSIMTLVRGAGIPASFAQACVIIGVMALSTTAPGPPGFLGTFQFGASCGLALYFPTYAEAATRFTFVSYCVQLLNALLCLIVGMWIVARTKKPEAQPVRRTGAAATAQQIAPSTKK